MLCINVNILSLHHLIYALYNIAMHRELTLILYFMSHIIFLAVSAREPTLDIRIGVCRREILTSKVDPPPPTVKVKKSIMVVDP